MTIQPTRDVTSEPQFTTFGMPMTTVEHTHTEFATKDEMADFRTIVTDMMLQLTQARLAADARMDRFDGRMDRFDGRMDRFEARLDEIGEELKILSMTMQELLETSRRGFGFQTSND